MKTKKEWIPTRCVRWRYKLGDKTYEIELAYEENELFLMMARRAVRNKRGKATAMKGNLRSKVLQEFK